MTATLSATEWLDAEIKRCQRQRALLSDQLDGNFAAAAIADPFDEAVTRGIALGLPIDVARRQAAHIEEARSGVRLGLGRARQAVVAELAALRKIRELAETSPGARK